MNLALAFDAGGFLAAGGAAGGRERGRREVIQVVANVRFLDSWYCWRGFSNFSKGEFYQRKEKRKTSTVSGKKEFTSTRAYGIYESWRLSGSRWNGRRILFCRKEPQKEKRKGN